MQYKPSTHLFGNVEGYVLFIRMRDIDKMLQKPSQASFSQSPGYQPIKRQKRSASVLVLPSVGNAMFAV